MNSDENPRDDEKPQDHDHVSSDERAIQGEVDEELQEEVYREFVVPESANQLRIDLFLTQSCDGYSRTQIRNAVQKNELQRSVTHKHLRFLSGLVIKSFHLLTQ